MKDNERRMQANVIMLHGTVPTALRQASASPLQHEKDSVDIKI
jgi:hypothetical protein